MLLSVVLASLAIQRGCRSSSFHRAAVEAPEHGPLRLELHVPDSVQSGKVVPIWLIATNKSSDSVYLALNGDRKSSAATEFDIQVDDAAGSEVWRRIRSEQARGLTPIRVGKGDSRVIPPHGRVAWSADWNQRDNHGTLVAPGEYSVAGIIAVVVAGPAPTDSLRSPRRTLIISR